MIEIIFKNSIDSILRIREEISEASDSIHYYDSGHIYILSNEGQLKLKCDSLQEFAFQMVDYVANITDSRKLSDNENYNLVLLLDGERVKMKEEWMEVNYFKELTVELNLLKNQALSLYELINKELGILIPEIVKSSQFSQHVNKLEQVSVD